MSEGLGSGEMVNGRPIVFMCYAGAERSWAIQKVYQEAGMSVDIFDGGTRRLCRMDPDSIKKELENKFVYLIYDQRSKNVEHSAKAKATELLDRAGIEHTEVDTPSLSIMAHNLGGDLDNYLL